MSGQYRVAMARDPSGPRPPLGHGPRALIAALLVLGVTVPSVVIRALIEATPGQRPAGGRRVDSGSGGGDGLARAAGVVPPAGRVAVVGRPGGPLRLRRDRLAAGLPAVPRLGHPGEDFSLEPGEGINSWGVFPAVPSAGSYFSLDWYGFDTVEGLKL
ncbi:hypothetical protein AB0H57_23375 [Micromonospora sp. NPDC050686]|uniref:hypothetical protein n=1 Tax=Micromonospora sp. NPDC050686 TaxID=3154631 RepID=UPI00340BFCFC